MHELRIKTNNAAEWKIDLLIQDDLDYAYDATICMERDNHQQMRERMRNYDIATETRDFKIQWVKVLLLMHTGTDPKEELPPPFGLIKFSTGGTIIGTEIYMTWNITNAVTARIKK